MSVNDEENNDPGPSPAEQINALRMIKRFAYDGYVKETGTDEGFTQLWRTAFHVKNIEPNPNATSVNAESEESPQKILSPSTAGKRGFQILPGETRNDV